MMKYTIEEKYYLVKKDIIKMNSTNPLEIVKTIMKNDYIDIHGPIHHFLDGAAFLVAYNNVTNSINIDNAIEELSSRTIKMPGAMCGLWGICGATSSIGASLSIIHKTSPLSKDEFYKHHMEYTASVIKRMSEIGGPRCCKRNAFIALESGINFVQTKYGVELTKEAINCEFSNFNQQCLKEKCPFFINK